MAGNGVNGRDRDTSAPENTEHEGPNDLQYACLFPLPEPSDCELSQGAPFCEGNAGSNDNPLCAERLDSAQPTTTQYWAGAYPGTRHVQILQQLGRQATVGSICPTNVDDSSRQDHAYRPVVAAWENAMASSLGASAQERE